MNINIPTLDDDDPQFMKVVNQVLLRLLKHHSPAEAYVIRIDRWFDYKWLDFSGKGRMNFNGGLMIEVALDEFRQDITTFPPFTPSRVLDESHFFRAGVDEYFESVPDKFVHRSMRSHSSRNLHRRVADFSKSGVFMWFNSGTRTSQQGSLMVYAVAEGAVQTWFASLEKTGRWKLLQAKGTTREHVLSLASGVPDGPE